MLLHVRFNYANCTLLSRGRPFQILRDEKLGVRPYFMPESAILPATEAVSCPLRPRMRSHCSNILGNREV